MAEMAALKLGQYNHGNQPQHHCLCARWPYNLTLPPTLTLTLTLTLILTRPVHDRGRGSREDAEVGATRVRHALHRRCGWTAGRRGQWGECAAAATSHAVAALGPGSLTPTPSTPNHRPPARPPALTPSAGARQCVRGTCSHPSGSSKCALATRSTPSALPASVAPRCTPTASPAPPSRPRRTRPTTSMCTSRPRASMERRSIART